MQRYRVQHLTSYEYSEAVSLAYNEARLLPRSFETPLYAQHCLHHQLNISPRPRDRHGRADFFGNHVIFFSFDEGYQAMTIDSTSYVQRSSPFDQAGVRAYLREGLADLNWADVIKTLKSGVDSWPPVQQFSLASVQVPLLEEARNYAALSFDRTTSFIEAVLELMTRIYEDFSYTPGATQIGTPLKTIAAEKKGVCQDYSHFMIACLRSLGFACRYVSGYLETLPLPGKERLVGADASHAWCSVYIPEFGWLDLDPTNNQVPLEQHISVAWGRDYDDVTPLKGVIYSSGKQTLKVSVDVAPQA